LQEVRGRPLPECRSPFSRSPLVFPLYLAKVGVSLILVKSRVLSSVPWAVVRFLIPPKHWRTGLWRALRTGLNPHFYPHSNLSTGAPQILSSRCLKPIPLFSRFCCRIWGNAGHGWKLCAVLRRLLNIFFLHVPPSLTARGYRPSRLSRGSGGADFSSGVFWTSPWGTWPTSFVFLRICATVLAFSVPFSWALFLL